MSGEHLQPKDQKQTHELPSSYPSLYLPHLSTGTPDSSSAQALNFGLILTPLFHISHININL